MVNRDFDPIETSGGSQPKSSIAERSAVGLALLVLVGAVLIALGNLLPGDDRPGATSAPVARATPRATPRATQAPPALSQVVLEPGVAPSAEPQPTVYPYSGWIRATAAVTTHRSPDIAAAPGDPLTAEEVAWADEMPDAPGWLLATTSTGAVWIEPEIAQSVLIERVHGPEYPMSGYVGSLTAGGNGFMATVVQAQYAGNGRSTVMFSVDGATWEATDLPNADASSVAWGPAGWLAATVPFSGSVSLGGGQGAPLEVWKSRDGLHWEPLGYAPTGLGATGGLRLVGSEPAYLIESYSGRSGQPSLWSSRDGLAWRESAIPIGFLDLGSAQVAGLGAGFYLWDTNGTGSSAFSANGTDWSAVEGGPTTYDAQIVQVGDRVVALSTDQNTGAVRTYTGSIVEGTVAWDQPIGGGWSVDSGDIGFGGLTSDGERALAIGWRPATDAVVAWESLDGVDWRPVALPQGAFGGIPRLAAAGPTGAVVVGVRPTARGDNPVFWHRTDTGWWEPELSPALGLVPDPSRDDGCSAPPRSGLDLLLLDRALAVVCFGDAPITFRAWSVECDCTGDPDGTYQPAWLASPGSNQLFLSPINSTVSTASVVLAPALGATPNPSWTTALVEVTGHFDDLAAASCHWTPGPSQYLYYSGQRGVLDACRQQFVVTAVKLVTT